MLIEDSGKYLLCFMIWGQERWIELENNNVGLKKLKTTAPKPQKMSVWYPELLL